MSLPIKALRDICEGNFNMAHLDGNSLNQIFEELARWEAMLGEAEIESNEPDPPAPN